MSKLEFDRTDIVQIGGYTALFEVMGVIHDDERLFVRAFDNSTMTEEFEVPFSAVEMIWKLVEGTL